MAIQIGTVDGLITITKNNFKCFTSAIYNFSQDGIEYAVKRGISFGAAFQRYVEPVYTGKSKDFNIVSIDSPAYTRGGKEQSPARVTFCRKMGLLNVDDSHNIFQLTPIALELYKENITIEEYAFVLMTKQGIFKDGVYVQNLFAFIAEWFDKHAMISELDLKSAVCGIYGDPDVEKTRIDIILNALALCGLIVNVGSGKYVLASITAADIFKDFLLHNKRISNALRDDDSCYTNYIGSVEYGIFDILSSKNSSIYARLYPNICKYIIIKMDKIHQQIFYGAPGTGKSHTINRDTKGHKTFRTTFHPDSDYSTFVGAYKPVMEEVETRVVPVVLNNGTIFDQNNGTLKEKEIGYKFVKQAFMKAYIAAWRTFTNNSNVTITSQAPSLISLSYNNQTWILTAVSDDSVLYTKEDIMSVDEYKNNVLTYWPTIPVPDENGKFKLGTFDHYHAAGCAWYRGIHGKNHSADECWEAIKNVLEAGGAIEATPNSQTYSILLRDGKIVAITRDNKAYKNTIKRCFENADADSSVQKRIAKELKEFNANDFDKAWEELKTRVNGMVIPESTNTDEIPPVFLIIEEINRGNCAQIFGDLFQLLDRKEGFSQYPIHADDDIRKCLVAEHSDEDPSFGTNGLMFSDGQKTLINSVLDCEEDIAEKIAHGEVLVLPPNLYIWATMNTSDQSLFPIDSAFKRRWDWKYRPITKGRDNDGSELNWRIKADTKEYDWWSFLVKINEIIGSTTNSEDKKLGFFFCKPTDGVISAETFVGKVIFYLWNDVFKDFGFDEDIFHDEKLEDGTYSTLNFNKFYTTTAAGETIVLKDKVEKFLDNLKVEEAIIDDSKSVGNFSLDGVKGMTLGEIAKKIVTKYAQNNLGKSAQEIRNIFVEQCKGIGVSHVVETEEEYHKRDGQASQERSASEITIPNGEKLYVTTQWRAKKDSDNFIKFIDIVGRNGWGTITPAR